MRVAPRSGTRPSEESVYTRGGFVSSVRLVHQELPIQMFRIVSPHSSRLIRDFSVSPEAVPRIAGIVTGAPGGIRTPNLLIRSQMLYPLSYGRSVGRLREKTTCSA